MRTYLLRTNREVSVKAKLPLALMFLAVSVVASANAFAKSPYITSDASETVNQTIITPATSIDGIRTSQVGRTANGDTVVCPTHLRTDVEHSCRGTCVDNKGNSAWVYLKDAVPRGKTYVGFRISTGFACGTGTAYEIFWK